MPLIQSTKWVLSPDCALGIVKEMKIIGDTLLIRECGHIEIFSSNGKSPNGTCPYCNPVSNHKDLDKIAQLEESCNKLNDQLATLHKENEIISTKYFKLADQDNTKDFKIDNLRGIIKKLSELL